jgi:hypothetical protein
MFFCTAATTAAPWYIVLAQLRCRLLWISHQRSSSSGSSAAAALALLLLAAKLAGALQARTYQGVRCCSGTADVLSCTLQCWQQQ